MIRHTRADRIFIAVNTALLSLFFLIIIYPLLFVVTASFSGRATVMSLNLWPESPTLIGYKTVFEYVFIWVGYRNSLIYTVVGTLLSLAVTICCAYPLSRRNLRYGKYMMGLCVFTMYFSGGLIPFYILMRSLRMLDTIWAIVLPGSLSVYNMIIMRTYFMRQIPEELLEASQIDGCGDIYYLLRIVLPLSVPIIAVVALYVAVGIWNSYFNMMILISTRNKMPLQIFLREILVLNSFDGNSIQNLASAETMAAMERRKEIMKYALIIVSSAPVMLLYPFIQRYFVKGIMIGSVKG